MAKIKKEQKSKESKIVRKLSIMNSGDELRIKSVSDVCKTLNDLQQIAAVCEEKCVSVVFEDDNFVISGKQELTLAKALETIIRARKIIVSAQTKAGLDKARKAGKRLGTIPGSRWRAKKLTGREKEIQTFLDNNISLSAIARTLKVNPQTLKAFMKDSGLSREKTAPACHKAATASLRSNKNLKSGTGIKDTKGANNNGADNA